MVFHFIQSESWGPCWGWQSDLLSPSHLRLVLPLLSALHGFPAVPTSWAHSCLRSFACAAIRFELRTLSLDIHMVCSITSLGLHSHGNLSVGPLLTTLFKIAAASVYLLLPALPDLSLCLIFFHTIMWHIKCLACLFVNSCTRFEPPWGQGLLQFFHLSVPTV